jgi:hypothetical protein
MMPGWIQTSRNGLLTGASHRGSTQGAAAMNRPHTRLPLRAIATMSPGKLLKWLLVLAVMALAGVLAYFAAIEMQTSRLQARYFASIGRQISFSVEPGPSNSIRFPTSHGPYDIRLGYGRLPDFEARLRARLYRHKPGARLGNDGFDCRLRPVRAV